MDSPAWLYTAMEAVTQSALLGLLSVALGIALLGWWTAHNRVRWSNRRRQQVASGGEDAANALLEEAGFEVLGEQVTVEFPMWIDGEEVWVHNRVDRVVRRDGWIYVADVKTGDRARDPCSPATRRQLREYLITHEADGALVVDMDAEVIVEVAFEEEPSGD